MVIRLPYSKNMIANLYILVAIISLRLDQLTQRIVPSVQPTKADSRTVCVITTMVEPVPGISGRTLVQDYSEGFFQRALGAGLQVA
jgi:hypothetical protein